MGKQRVIPVIIYHISFYLPGHSLFLQCTVLVEEPLHFPPCSSFTFLVRVSTLVPSPHSAEHWPMFQLFQTQWTGSFEHASVTKNIFEDIWVVLTWLYYNAIPQFKIYYSNKFSNLSWWHKRQRPEIVEFYPLL